MAVGCDGSVEIRDAGNTRGRIDETRRRQIHLLHRNLGLQRRQRGIVRRSTGPAVPSSFKCPPPAGWRVILKGKELVRERLVTSMFTLSYTRGFSDDPARLTVRRPSFTFSFATERLGLLEGARRAALVSLSGCCWSGLRRSAARARVSQAGEVPLLSVLRAHQADLRLVERQLGDVQRSWKKSAASVPRPLSAIWLAQRASC